jgi:hypothetical protein
MIRIVCLSVLFTFSSVARPQSVGELKVMVEERDATIRELQQRIEALENKKPLRSAQPSRPASPTDADDEELDRALERTLVQQGGLVLRRGTYEFEPQLSYSHWDPNRSSFRHELDSAVSLRAGLGWDTQLQVHVPYVNVTTSAGSATSIGDVDLAFSKQFARESQSGPGLVGSIGWVSRTGKNELDGTVPTGSGFNVLQGALTAVKRHDPMVFYGGLSYASALSREISGARISPGNILGVRAGGVLAVRPDTSINVGLNLGFAGTGSVNGQSVQNSDATIGSLQIGIGIVVTRTIMLNFSTDIRVTGAVPDYRLTASVPIRF